MVSPDRAAGATGGVSIHEENNVEVEIPRYDPKDKPKLWISKVEIHHNTMMEKIRGLVQIKLFELVGSNEEAFFKGVEDVIIDMDNVDGQQKLESKEDILLAKKAQMINNRLNEIMELPKDEILSFLTSSSLPSGSHGSSEESPERKEHSANHTASSSNASDTATEERSKVDNNQDEENHDDYNWILDCGDSWKDLPAVVRVNAIQLGYNQKLWDEDAQDLPVFKKLWKDLSPNEKTAAVFLGNYDEEVWNEDARILMMAAAKQPSLSSIDDEDDVPVEAVSKKPKYDTKKDAASNNDDNDDMFSEFVSNFASNVDEGNEVTKDVVAPQEEETEEDSEAMMDEFVSNFVVTKENDNASGSAKASSVVSDTEDDSEAMMDEFLSNFAEPTKEEEDDETEEKESASTNIQTTRTKEAEKEDEEAMMDEFLSNFVESANDENNNTKQTFETDDSNPTTSGNNKKEEEEEAMMDEFLANFVTSDEDGVENSNKSTSSIDENVNVTMTGKVVSNFEASKEQESGETSSSEHGRSETESLAIPSKSLVSNYESVQDSGKNDEEQPLVSKPREYVMERGFQGEESPLLPVTKTAAETESQPQKPEEPPSTWETVSSYLYWIPVVIGIPVVYMMASGDRT